MATQWVSRRQDQIIQLSTAEQENNVTCLWERLSPLGYTAEAIAAIAGNMQYEGLLNPAQYESGYNYSLSAGGGLCGWTPIYDASDTYYRHLKNWCDLQSLNYEDGDAQCSYLNYELTDWNNVERFFLNNLAPTVTYPITYPVQPTMTAASFITADYQSSVGFYSVDEYVEYLAGVWILYYEHPANPTDPNSGVSVRQSAAVSWYNFLQNLPPTPPTPTTRRKMPIWMMCRRNKTIRRF